MNSHLDKVESLDGVITRLQYLLYVTDVIDSDGALLYGDGNPAVAKTRWGNGLRIELSIDEGRQLMLILQSVRGGG